MASSIVSAAARTISWAELTDPGPELGRGAFGAVRRYRYHGTAVAVKELLGLGNVLRDSPGEVYAFLREAALQCALRHDHVISVFGVAVDAAMHRYGLVMQLAEGSLEARLSSLAPRKRLEFAHQIAAGLAYMHANSIVHADIKPANVLMLPEGRGVAISD